MGQYLSIQSRDPFDSGDIESFHVLAGDLAKAGQPQGGDEQ